MNESRQEQAKIGEIEGNGMLIFLIYYIYANCEMLQYKCLPNTNVSLLL